MVGGYGIDCTIRGDGLSFVAMYLMYAMVYSIDHIYMNFNQVYMASLMTAPMIVIELFVMHRLSATADKSPAEHHHNCGLFAGGRGVNSDAQPGRSFNSTCHQHDSARHGVRRFDRPAPTGGPFARQICARFASATTTD